MKTHPLSAFKSGGRYLTAGSTSSTDEYIRETNEFSLIEYLVDESFGRTAKRYRLFTRTPMSFADSLEYDIACPSCGSQLRLCGDYIDSNNHGLYKCRRCDEERSRF